VLTVAWAGTLQGCYEETWCVEGIQGGDELEVTILEVHDENTSYEYISGINVYTNPDGSFGTFPSCNLPDAPRVGDVLPVQLSEETVFRGGCDVPFCDPDFVRPTLDPAPLGRGGLSAVPGDTVCGQEPGRRVELAPGCVVTQDVRLKSLARVRDTSEPGAIPPFILEVIYFADPRTEQTCEGVPILEDEGICKDHWIVDVTHAD
jgi:hypothetical protein